MKGLNNIKRLLKNRGSEINRKADKLVKETAFIGRNVAVQKAPSAFGKLRQGINIKTSHLKAEVFSQMPYSVYVEFGTGKKFDMPSDTPQELKDAANAMKGKKNGNWKDFMKSLSKWARLKGIPQEQVYFIALSIYHNGSEPQPFMRPAYIASRAALKLGLKTIMK